MSDNPRKLLVSDGKPLDVGGAFALLAPGVQQQLWRMGWTHLRPIQVDAIRHVICTDGHCVIAAETAGGKTEAAFLPVLSKISEQPLGSVRAMYIGPLRALINDQFRRVEELCGYLEMPVYRWHGDVEASSKSRLVKEPGGVLLITPESLESLFINRSSQLRRLFGGLRFVVIDELHAFLDNERGRHLQSLLSRLRGVCHPEAFRIVGLSATIGDIAIAQKYVDVDRPQLVHIIQDNSGDKELKYRMHAYLCEVADDNEKEEEEDGDDAVVAVMRAIATDLVEHCRSHSNLVFANRKSDIEIYADFGNEMCRRQRLQEFFLVHHGSLAKDVREDTEAEMKSARTRTTICSSTLEMGIDIGSVKMVGQIGAPWSVASLKQRLGRSGRKDGEPRILRMYIECEAPTPRSDLLNRLHLELVQAIAISELMLEGWVEPPRPAACDLSTLIQQCISVIAETGGLQASAMYDRLCAKGAFRSIEAALFAALLRSLGANDVVEQTPQGDLILGLHGEKIRAGRDFYAAFQSSVEFSVIHGDRLIGSLPMTSVPGVDHHLLLAGRRWKVVEVDPERAEILVQPARGRSAPRFDGSGGDIHPRIRRRMREVLSSTATYAYLNPLGGTLLDQARKTAREAGILNESLHSIAAGTTLWFTWTGSHIQTTLVAMLASRKIDATDRTIAIEVALPASELEEALSELADQPPDALTVASNVLPKERRKYDYLLTEELQNLSLSRDVVDVTGAIAVCREALQAEPQEGDM